jgi:hypothetical protein
VYRPAGLWGFGGSELPEGSSNFAYPDDALHIEDLGILKAVIVLAGRYLAVLLGYSQPMINKIGKGLNSRLQAVPRAADCQMPSGVFP